MEISDLARQVVGDPRHLLRLADGEESGRVVEMLWLLSVDGGREKSVRKAAKKALYMLRSTGIDVDRYRPADPSLRGSPDGESVAGAFLSTPDSSGSTFLMLVLSDERALTNTLYQAVADPERGITNLSSRKTSMKSVEKLLEQRPEVFSAPAWYVLARLRHAVEHSEKGGVDSLPGSLKAHVLNARSLEEAPHPILSVVSAGLSRILHPDEEKRLFALEELGRLALYGEEVARYREQVEQARQSRLILENRNPDERVMDVIDRFTTVHFTPQRRSAYSRMLCDVALSLHGRGMNDEAKALVSWAHEILSAGPSLKNHPFVRYLVYKAFLLEREP